MPIVKQKKVHISGTQNQGLVRSCVGHCHPEHLAVHKGCRSINGILVVSPRSTGDINTLKSEIDHDKWEAPTLWEHALCAEELKKMLGDKLSDAMIISNHPYPEEPEDENKTVSALFHHKGKLLLEAVPATVIPKLSRPRYFIFVSHP